MSETSKEVVTAIDERFAKELPLGLAKSLWSLWIQDNKRATKLEAENAHLRADLRRWLEKIGGTPPEALWEMEEPRMDYVSIQVDKKDYEEARAALKAMGEE